MTDEGKKRYNENYEFERRLGQEASRQNDVPKLIRHLATPALDGVFSAMAITAATAYTMFGTKLGKKICGDAKDMTMGKASKLGLIALGAGIVAGTAKGIRSERQVNERIDKKRRELSEIQKREDELLAKYRKNPKDEHIKDELWKNRFGISYKEQLLEDKELEEIDRM